MLMIFTATLNCMMGLVIADAKTQSIKRLGLIVAVIISLGLFVIFKYTGFIIQNLNDLFGLMLPIPNIALPIGISFYTFQALSYTIDVYRGDVQAQRSPLKFLMYISLYTQLVAGPIVRYSDIDNEVDVRHENLADISSGLTRFCIGLTKSGGGQYRRTAIGSVVRWRPCRPDHPWGLVWHMSLCTANLLRLFGLFRYGHRSLQCVWF